MTGLDRLFCIYQRVNNTRVPNNLKIIRCFYNSNCFIDCERLKPITDVLCVKLKEYTKPDYDPGFRHLEFEVADISINCYLVVSGPWMGYEYFKKIDTMSCYNFRLELDKIFEDMM